ncbi:CBS domain-containing protein [Gemmatimonas groenlandica]|uniref:CBS domain-containing protein n=1 Tax=Gemmatimonas groenlandica TaxID=2732249 RepID=A0A6M4IMQ4_9BACT|nr:CBS domain-containing protein [Gemmatimonas groenlandica]QJR35059.1 CBS domain-containing protein [Gemmatimonas groenlandica]
MPITPQRLADLLVASRVIMPLTAGTVADAAEALCVSLDESGALSNADLLRERIEEARSEDIVGLADRAFVLHYRTDAVRDLVVSIGVAPKDVVRVLDDNELQRARLVVLVCAPPRQMARHLQVVSALVRVLSNPATVAAALAAETPAQLVALAQFTGKELPAQLTVRELMSERPRTVGPEAPLRSAVLEMLRAGLGGLPVVDESNRVIGMLSERELLRDLLSHYLPRAGGVNALQPPAAARRTVRDIMTRQVLCVAPEQPLAEVASLMLNKDVDRVPVVKDDRLVGFLTRGDIVRKLIGS